MATETQNRAKEWLVGGGRMGELIRSMDWSNTPLGDRVSWPPSLRTTINLCLASNFPICFTWGPNRVQIYNDGYWPICGEKHPTSMGQDYRECWASPWPVVGPGFERCMATGETTFVTDTRMFLDRNGYVEETFFTYSFSPIRDEAGGIGGIFHPVTETTHLVLAERRLSALRALAAATADSRTVHDALAQAAVALAEYQLDLPFVLLYRLNSVAHLAGASGLMPGTLGAPETIDLSQHADKTWPLESVVQNGRPVLVNEIGGRFGPLVCQPYAEPIQQALVFPISAGGARPLAVMVAGVSTRRALDDAYRQFYDLLAAAVTTAVATARAYEEERRRAEELAELDRAKTAFFSNVSHEFRTPLTLMLGPLEDTLAGRTLDGSDREHVTVAHRNGLRLLKLVNALLDFSRIEAGRVEAAFEPTDLAALTVDLASTFRSAMEKAGLTFDVDCPPLSELVFVDPDMWEKVVLNLLSNAFKFTLTGRVTVGLRSTGGAVELTVEDTGVGIPAAEIGRVFERFHRIEGADGRTHEGTGIGLALVKELVKLHGGTVTVESEPGSGTKFTVTLLFGREHFPPGHVCAEGRSRTSLASPFVEEALRWLPGEHVVQDAPNEGPLARIVLADDNADMREYVARLLSVRYEVTAVADGEAALAAIHRSPPELVLSDVMMPRLDGFGLLARLRADPRTASVPVVILSARAGEEAKVEGLDAGADDYLVKPFSGKELLARVRATLETARLRQDSAHREQRERSLKEEASRKDAFIAMLAHELRNPLGPIRNAVQLLGVQRDTATAERVREMIERQVGHMARIVDDLLDVSRVARKKVELRRERLDLAQLVFLIAGDEAAAFEKAGLKIELTVSELPVWVSGDRTRLTQIVTNLLGNALKFTDRGGKVTVTVRGDSGEAVLSVADTGVGIEADLLPHLFTAFTQADKTLARTRGGLGLGLSMVKGLVELHGGTVGAASDGPGRGSIFTARLPRLDEPAALAAGRPPISRGAEVRPARVLIVEDNRDAAESLQMLLEISGCEVRVAYTGPDGVAAAKAMSPDLVLCDIGLPGISGYEVARQIRAEFHGRNPVLVALTGYGGDDDRAKAKAAGFDEHFTKPVDPAALGSLIAT
ncbi:ATP-binding protein [Fimbriiglobus ruber]|uniref:histidine kinase n=1 Tax=Fimbriiglobus ruber TaxID=1908690 RepID=A0A225DQM1_9BACT|nr:ATP-binding protein [Fimbriiglobus ruber]OWK39836.1 Chemotaxis protein methyltransferase CheR [Fimbriiglobus ruber]